MGVGLPKPAEHLVLAALTLVLSFVQAKERTSSLYQDKKKKGTKEYSLLV